MRLQTNIRADNIQRIKKTSAQNQSQIVAKMGKVNDTLYPNTVQNKSGYYDV